MIDSFVIVLPEQEQSITQVPINQPIFIEQERVGALGLYKIEVLVCHHLQCSCEKTTYI